MSYIEKSAKKLLPILKTVRKKLIPEKERIRKFNKEEDVLIVDLNNVDEKKLMKDKEEQVDMKYILGYLNQGENLQNVTIGSMMQL